MIRKRIDCEETTVNEAYEKRKVRKTRSLKREVEFLKMPVSYGYIVSARSAVLARILMQNSWRKMMIDEGMNSAAKLLK
jgi:hypothetical protein